VGESASSSFPGKGLVLPGEKKTKKKPKIKKTKTKVTRKTIKRGLAVRIPQCMRVDESDSSGLAQEGKKKIRKKNGSSQMIEYTAVGGLAEGKG
jgi:hypothetical protein